MDRSIIRNAGLSLVLCAGLGMGVAAMANQAYAAETADKAAATETVAAAYTDGDYTAEGKGIGGKVPVTVTVKDGKIATVTVGDNSETQGIGSKAIEQLPDAIVKANGTEGVDAVSGATVTSKAIFSAVEESLEQAKGGAAEKADKAEGFADGDYTAEGKGIGGKVPVTVTVKDGKVSEVKVGDNSETQGIGSKAIEQLPDAIVKANGTEGVDAVSGATVTSKAIFTAVEDCLKQAAPAADDKAADAKADKAEAGALKDGSYTAEGKGIGGKVPVTVEVKDGKIATVTVGDNSETQGIGTKAIEKLPEAIVAANGTEGVDAVSGATVTSKAVFSAVDEILDQAKA